MFLYVCLINECVRSEVSGLKGVDKHGFKGYTMWQ